MYNFTQNGPNGYQTIGFPPNANPQYVGQNPPPNTLPPQLSHLFNAPLPVLPPFALHHYYPPQPYAPTPAYSLFPPVAPPVVSNQTRATGNPQDLKQIEDYIVGLLGKSKISEDETSVHKESSVTTPSTEPSIFSNSSTDEENQDESVLVETIEKPLGASRADNNHQANPLPLNRANLVHPTEFNSFTDGVLQIYRDLRPYPGEFGKRLKVLRALQKIIINIWPDCNPSLHLFGSSANNFGIKNSDMDLCLTIDEKAGTMQEVVRKLGETLKKKKMLFVKSLTRARVPIVKFTDPTSRFSCDICINNHLAIQNTKLIADYAKIDERFQQLGYLIKYWAKQRQINNTYQGTLSSYSYLLMVIHYLQRIQPPILPVLQEMRDPEDATVKVIISDFDCYYYTKVDTLRGFGSANKQSVGELFAGFFKLYSLDYDWDNWVISPRTGKYLTKIEKKWDGLTPSDDERDSFCCAIEDPFETSHNLGNVVDQSTLDVIRWEFNRAYKMICSSEPVSTICKLYDERDLKDYLSPHEDTEPFGKVAFMNMGIISYSAVWGAGITLPVYLPGRD